jgi:hypothetical protein
MARMRRKFADRNEGIMNSRLRENNYTAGRMRPGDLYAKKLWEAQNAPESHESIGGGTLGDWRNQASNIGLKIGATAGELFGGRSAMADEDEEMRLLRSGLDATTGYGSGARSSLETMGVDEQAELLSDLGLSATDAVKVPTGGIDPNSMLQDPTAGITPPNYPRWQNLWGALPWNRGGIASLRRYR